MDTHSIMPSILPIVILLLLSAYFSATETAFTSLNRIKVKNKADSGDKRARRVLKLEQNYDDLLSTILIGNNLVNIGMTAMMTLLFVDAYGAKGATIATIVSTVIVLIFGEISPKSLAKENPESFAGFSAPFIGALCIVMTPLNWLFSMWKKLVSAIFKTHANYSITEDELVTIVDEAFVTGGIDAYQNELIQKAIGFGDLEAQDVLTPRVDIEAIEINTPEEEIDRLFRETGFSRLPVYSEDLDTILGVLTQKDFHNRIYKYKRKLSDVMRPVIYVAATIKVDDLLRKLQENKSRMAIVVDEYGGTVGIVTAEDIIEELVGEIYDAGDTISASEMTPMQNGDYRVLGSANVEKMFDFFGEEPEIDATTVNGWAAMELDKIPVKGDEFEFDTAEKKFMVKVTEADERKALELQIHIEHTDKNEKGDE
jgi:putative hemolysin